MFAKTFRKKSTATQVQKKNTEWLKKERKKMLVIQGIEKLSHRVTEYGIEVISIYPSTEHVVFSDVAFRYFLADIKGGINKQRLVQFLSICRLYCGFSQNYVNGLQQSIGKEKTFSVRDDSRITFDILDKKGNIIYTGWHTPGNLFYRETMRDARLESYARRADRIEKEINKIFK